MNKITQFLKQDRIQRRCYVVLLICWLFIFLDVDRRAYITSYTDYLPLIFIIPVLLLVLQILFNNRIIWFIIVACIIAHTLWTLLKLYMHIVIDYHREYSHAIEWNTETILRFICIVLSFLIVNWFIFKIRPTKKS
jgi:hypothetical protein